MVRSLEPEQIDLLSRLVDVLRSAPRSQRGRFLVSTDMNDMHVCVWNEGVSDVEIKALPVDLQALAAEGLISFCDQHIFSVSPHGLHFYEEHKLAQGRPVERVERTVRGYLETDRLRSAYPTAYEKWQAAEAMLWADDSNRNLTTVGHLCREALQEFADVLARRLGLDQAHPEKGKTINRITAAIEKTVSSRTDRSLLEALVAYWRATNEVVQRQEHGAQDAAQQLSWQDARLSVFHSLFVMYEVDRVVSRF